MRFDRPYGTKRGKGAIHEPSDKSLGYFRASLRDVLQDEGLSSSPVFRDCTEFCGTGFKPVKKHGQDGRATLLDTKFRTVPPFHPPPLQCVHISGKFAVLTEF